MDTEEAELPGVTLSRPPCREAEPLRQQEELRLDYGLPDRAWAAERCWVGFGVAAPGENPGRAQATGPQPGTWGLAEPPAPPPTTLHPSSILSLLQPANPAWFPAALRTPRRQVMSKYTVRVATSSLLGSGTWDRVSVSLDGTPDESSRLRLDGFGKDFRQDAMSAVLAETPSHSNPHGLRGDSAPGRGPGAAGARAQGAPSTARAPPALCRWLQLMLPGGAPLRFHCYQWLEGEGSQVLREGQVSRGRAGAFPLREANAGSGPERAPVRWCGHWWEEGKVEEGRPSGGDSRVLCEGGVMVGRNDTDSRTELVEEPVVGRNQWF